MKTCAHQTLALASERVTNFQILNRDAKFQDRPEKKISKVERM